MMKKGNILIVGMVLVLFLAACSQQSSEEKQEMAVQEAAWNMKTEMVLVDNCPVSCACLFGGEPHHGYCRFVGAVHIVEGSHKGTSLSLGVAFIEILS